MSASWLPWINAGVGAAGAGAGIYSSIDGKNARESAEKEQKRLIDFQINQGTQMMNQTAPLRTGFVNNATADLAGQVTPAQRAIAEAQYGRAREATIATSGARGGQLTKALTDLGTDRARNLTGIVADNRARAMGQAGGVGFGAAGTSLGTVANAAGAYGNIANMASAREIAGSQSVGNMAAMAQLMALKKSENDNPWSSPYDREAYYRYRRGER